MPSAGNIFVSLGLDLRNLIKGAQQATQALKSIEDYSAKLQIKGPDAQRLIAVRDTLAETTALYKDFAKVAQSATTGLSNSFSSVKDKIQSTSTILTASFANINNIIQKEVGTTNALKKVYTELGAGMNEVTMYGKVTAETYNKIDSALSALSPKLRQQVTDLGQIGKQTNLYTVFDKMREGALKLAKQGLNPVTVELLKMQNQLAREFRVVTEMDKATISAAQLRQKIDTLTEAHSRGIVSIDSLTEKYKSYQQLQKLGETLSNKQVTDMQRTSAAIQILSQNSALASEVQKRLIADKGGIAALGTGYEAAGTKLTVFKQTVETLLNTYNAMNLFSRKEIADIKKKAVEYQQQSARLKVSEVSLKRVSQLEQTLSQG